MFSESRRVLKAERQLLAMFAIILSRIQGKVPSSGVLYLGRDCSLTTVRFGATLRAAENLIRDIERMQRAEKPPKLLLNDHCRICEFRERCHAQAVMEDNLSLLRGTRRKDDQEICQEGSTHADPTRSHVSVDGGVNPRKSGDDRKSGTRIAAPDQTLLAVFRSDANGCSVALCQRRQPPKAGAVGQRLQRVAGQSSWTIKNDGWFRIAQVRLTRERPYAKTVRFSKRTHRRLRADSRRRQQFRPRRRGKRSDQPLKLRDHALHALAIRDRTIYVLGKPEVPTARVRIYVDIEGNPDAGFIYLIGVIICDGERLEQHSFWADTQDKEATIFDQFLGIVSHYDAPRIYCYGVYEKAFFIRMRRHARGKKHIDAVLAALTNVLTIIFHTSTFQSIRMASRTWAAAWVSTGVTQPHRASRALPGESAGKRLVMNAGKRS